MSTFDEIIRQKANSHDAPVPPDAWDNIIKKEKKRRFGFFWWATGILLLCGLSILGYYEFSGTTGKYNNNRKIAAVIQKQAEPVSGNTSTKDAVTATQDQQINTNEKENTNGDKPNDKNNNIATNTTEDKLKDNTSAQIKDNNRDQNIDTKEKPSKQSNNITPTNTPSSKIHQSKNVETTELVSTVSVKPRPGKPSHRKIIDANPKDKKNKEANDASFANNNKKLIKEKGRSSLKIRAGEAEADPNSKDAKKSTADIAVSETTNNNDQTTSTEQQTTPTTDKKDIAETPVSKNELVPDSAQNKKPLAATTDENKTKTKNEKATVNKPAKKHAWFIDLAVSPVLPIEQYDKNLTFNRTLATQDNLSVFTGKLVSTDIDPSAAFSISLRREMNKKLFIGLGLQYLQLTEHVKISGTEVNTKYTIVDRLVNNVSGPQLISDTVKTISEGSRKITADNSYRFLSIPVFVQYNFVQKRSWSLGVVAGVNINVYSRYINEINKNALAPLTSSTQTNDAKNTVGISFFGGFRFGKRISKRMELFGTPSLSWAAGRQNIKNNLLNKKIQSAGINVGLSFQLKK